MKGFIKRNASTILTCIGGVGVVATAVLAVKATPKALDLLEQAREEKGDELTKLETVKVAGPVYIPAVLTGAGTLACIFGANVLNKRQQAGLMSAYALLDNSYKEYKKKIVELYGEEANKQVQAEIAKDHYEEQEVNDGNQLFYDQFSGRYFESTMEKVVRAEYEINRILSLFGEATLNDFYQALDNERLEPTEEGTCLGWSQGGLMYDSWSNWLDFEHDKVVMDDGLECIIITMRAEPTIDYGYY